MRNKNWLTIMSKKQLCILIVSQNKTKKQMYSLQPDSNILTSTKQVEATV